MLARNTQHGAASAIVVYILLAVVGGMVVVSLLMSRASLSDNNQKSDHLQARLLAESALEREIEALSNGTACASIAIPNQKNFAGGTFSTLSATLSGIDCVLEVQGVNNLVVVVIDATVAGAGGGGGMSYVEHFPAGSLVDWPATETSSQGTSALDAGANCGTCSGTPSGQALKFTTSTGGGWNNLTGYREELLPVFIDTTGGNVLLDFSLGYKKSVIGSASGVRQRIYLELYDSTNDRREEIWRHIGVSTDNVWVSEPSTYDLPSGYVFDYVRLRYNLRGRAGREPEVWVDEINLSTGS